MSNWRDNLGSAFGTDDGIFALHPADEDRAKRFLGAAKAEGVSREQFVNEIRKLATQKNWPQEHTDKQIERFHDFLFEHFEE